MPLGDSQPRYLSNEDGTDDEDFLHLQDVLCRSFSYCRPLPSLPKVVPHGSTGRGYMPQTPPPVQELWTSEAQEIVRTMFQSDFTELGYSQDRLSGWHRKRFLEVSSFFQEGRTCYILSLPISFFDASCTFPYNSDVYSLDMLHVSHTFSPNHSNAYILMSFNVSYTPALNLIFSLLAFDIILGTQ